jgi:putative FmdB family regulatory protein
MGHRDTQIAIAEERGGRPPGPLEHYTLGPLRSADDLIREALQIEVAAQRAYLAVISQIRTKDYLLSAAFILVDEVRHMTVWRRVAGSRDLLTGFSARVLCGNWRGMPIYEFYCSDCHRIFSFLSKSVDTSKLPACPRCHRATLTRRVSSFAISKGRKEEAKRAADPDLAGLPPGMDEARLEQAMATLTREAEGMNEEDPRQGAQLMRRLFEATGMPVGEGWKRRSAGWSRGKIRRRSKRRWRRDGGPARSRRRGLAREAGVQAGAPEPATSGPTAERRSRALRHVRKARA